VRNHDFTDNNYFMSQRNHGNCDSTGDSYSMSQGNCGNRDFMSEELIPQTIQTI